MRDDADHDEAYERGQAAGRLEVRLSSHEEHLTRLDGSVAKLGDGLDRTAAAVVDLKRSTSDAIAGASARTHDLFDAHAATSAATKQEARRMTLQFAGVVLGAVIAAATAIILALVTNPPPT